jgi:hypothetical protein
MLKFSVFLVFFLTLLPMNYVDAQSSLLDTFYNAFGIGINRNDRNQPARSNQNDEAPETPINPCPSIFEYVNEDNIIEGEIKLKTSERGTVVNLVFEANVPGSITSV